MLAIYFAAVWRNLTSVRSIQQIAKWLILAKSGIPIS